MKDTATRLIDASAPAEGDCRIWQRATTEGYA